MTATLQYSTMNGCGRLAKKRNKGAFEIYGFDELAAQFAAVGEAAKPAAERAVYKGAGVIADAIRKNINALPSDTFGYKKYQTGVSDSQRKALLGGLGITPIGDVNSIINARVGFDGYMSDYVSGDTVRTKKYPKGLPVPLLANAVESGSEHRAKHGFVRKAITANKEKALKAMADEFDKEIKKIIGG